jgi:YtxH-like protein
MATNLFTNVMSGVTALVALAATVRKLDTGDGLAWFGLARRRNPVWDVAIFSAGAATGASIALLFAPSSGAELRRRLTGGVSQAAKDMEARVDRATEATPPTDAGNQNNQALGSA